MCDWWADIEYYFYVDKEDRKYFAKEHSLWLLNHKYEIDWLSAWCIHDRIQILGVSYSFYDILLYAFSGWKSGEEESVPTPEKLPDDV